MKKFLLVIIVALIPKVAFAKWIAITDNKQVWYANDQSIAAIWEENGHCLFVYTYGSRDKIVILEQNCATFVNEAKLDITTKTFVEVDSK